MLLLDINSLMTKSATAPGAFRRDARPPISPDPAPTPGAVALPRRRTAVPRPSLCPVAAPMGHVDRSRHRDRTVPVTDAYVRRFWTAVIGPGAVADLLRLAAAAERGRSLLRPVHLATLLQHGLIAEVGGRIVVAPVVPSLPRSLVSCLPAGLRREHASWSAATR